MELHPKLGVTRFTFENIAECAVAHSVLRELPGSGAHDGSGGLVFAGADAIAVRRGRELGRQTAPLDESLYLAMHNRAVYDPWHSSRLKGSLEAFKPFELDDGDSIAFSDAVVLVARQRVSALSSGGDAEQLEAAQAAVAAARMFGGLMLAAQALPSLSPQYDAFAENFGNPKTGYFSDASRAARALLTAVAVELTQAGAGHSAGDGVTIDMGPSIRAFNTYRRSNPHLTGLAFPSYRPDS